MENKKGWKKREKPEFIEEISVKERSARRIRIGKKQKIRYTKEIKQKEVKCVTRTIAKVAKQKRK